MNMNTVINKDACTGCHACYHSCPVHAINMAEDSEGFLYPQIEQNLCVKCGKCRAVCPVLHMPPLFDGEEVYACAAADPKQRLESSSGGVFVLLAQQVLRQSGAVCGAAFDGVDCVRHVLVRRFEDLALLRGAKYVQSRIGDIFPEIDTALKQGEKILFSGTPCQVAGLKNYLGRDPENLLTVDLICHGVPSPGVWRDYVREIGEGEAVSELNFRRKSVSTGETLFSYRLENGELHECPQKDDLYTKGFLQNLYLRESCFACAFKGTKRCSDLTIGDMWCAKEFHPALCDEPGVSAVIIHSEKGRNAFAAIMSQTKHESSTKKEAAYWNECLLRSVAPTEKRAQFYDRWKREPLRSIIMELTAQSMQENPVSKKRTARQILRRIWNAVK